LVRVINNSLEAHIAQLLPGLTGSLDGKGATAPIKIEALGFLRALLQTHPAAVFHPYLPKITPPVYKNVAEKYAKISAEALLVCSEFAKVFPGKEGFDYAPLVAPLYTAAYLLFR